MEKADVEMENEEFVDVETPEIKVVDVQSLASSAQTVCETEDTNSLPEDLIGETPVIDYDSIGEFCFESDELALKGNTDYKNLLEAMVVLEAQKAKAIKDLEKLKRLQDEALSDPFEFVERLKRKENMNFPVPQEIYPIPVIDWSKYAVCGNSSSFCQRQMNLISTKLAQDLSRCSKSNPWTADEEKQLRDLLIEIPTEPCETGRWEKIASCLQSRSPTEVAMKAHMFALNKVDEKQCLVSGSLRKKSYVENTYETEIDMDIAEINPELRDSPEFKELVLLKKVLREKLDSTSLSRHMGYKCYSCKTEPIVGVRWHCMDCKPPLSVDFCNDCNGCLYETTQHSSNHRLERIHVSKAFLDRDYMQFVGSDYNYLDPNYMPAT